MNRSPVGTWFVLFLYVALCLAFDLLQPTDSGLIRAGALDPGYLAGGEIWRLVAASFVHSGLLHLGFNAYFLWIVGPVLERELGLERFLILYLVAGIGGNVAVGLLYPAGFFAVGGSGALFGMLGALVAILLRQEHSYRDFLDNRAGRQILALIAANLVLGWLLAFVSNTAHIGGLITGFGVAFFWFELPEAGQRLRRPPPVPALAFGLLLATGFALSTRPATSAWYQARALWYAHGTERAQPIRESLVVRGISPDVVALLDVLREYRDGAGSEERLRRLWGRGDIVTPLLDRLRFDRNALRAFAAAVDEGTGNAERFLAGDPWRHHDG